MTKILIKPDRTEKTELLPFLKWAGGKRWLIKEIEEILPNFSGKYIEPFLGGGAVFFYLEPNKALLSDINWDLINAYGAIKHDFERLLELLEEHQKKHSPDYYYRMRNYKPRCKFRSAARFIYLNRTCWNGLYRVNKKGEFNVPMGTKTSVIMPGDNWELVSKRLRSADLVCQDFEKSIDCAVEGDLVFADPPYTVKHNFNGFIKYNDSIFSWADQVRLKNALLRAKSRGVHVIATNAYHSSVKELYKNEFSLKAVERASVLAGSAIHRGRYEELLII